MAFSSRSVSGRFQFQRLTVTSLFLTVITAAVLLGAGPVRAQLSAVDQGKTLNSLAQSWGVSFSDWEANSDPCIGNWSHVTCDNATNSQVLKLNLASTKLKGPIPPAIGELAYLENLNLTNNGVTDPIPQEIGKLVHLQVLVLNSNNFTKVPPDALLNCNLTRL
jgi:2-methylcitrate dehydratase PrpD